MNCPMKSEESAGLLLAYCTGRLDTKTAAALSAHIDACPDCREMCARQRLLWDVLDRWESAPVSPDFNRRLYRRIEETCAGGFPRTFLRSLFSPVRPVIRRPVFSVLATLALLVAGFLVEYPGIRYAEQAGNRPSPAAEAITVQADQVENTLDDMEMLHELNPPARPDKSASRLM